MAVNPSWELVANTKDRSGERTALRANRAASDSMAAGLPAVLTDFLTAFAAFTELAAGNLTTATSNQLRKVNPGLRYGVGHREVKWELFFTDNVNGNAYSATVPLAISLDSISEGTDYLPNSDWAGTPIETSAEALFRSPDGNAGTLTAIKLVRGSS